MMEIDNELAPMTARLARLKTQQRNTTGIDRTFLNAEIGLLEGQINALKADREGSAPIYDFSEGFLFAREARRGS